MYDNGSGYVHSREDKAVKDKTETRMFIHVSGDGDLGGQIVNHSVTQDDTIGNTLINHALGDAAPTSKGFIEKISEKELAKVLGLTPYAGRALSISKKGKKGKKGDLIQLPKELKSGWEQISEHYELAGLNCAEDVIWEDGFDQALASPESTLDVFYFGKEAHRVRPDEKRFLATKRFNNKRNFLELVQSLGIEIPKTVFFDTKEDFQLPNTSKPLNVFKIDDSVAGLGTKICASKKEIVECAKNMAPGVGFHLQEDLGEDAQFISTQYVLENGEARFITPTCNFIGGRTFHKGNWGGEYFKEKFPNDPNELTHKIAKAIELFGGKKGIGIDIGVKADGTMYPVEANVRYTAAIYYFLTAQKLGMEDKWWAGKSYESTKKLSELDLRKIAYTEKRGYGWILTNWGPMIEGHGGGFLFVGPNQLLYHEAEKELKNFLA